MAERPEDLNCLVSAPALIAVRDEKTSRWMPLGGGGLSHLSLRKCAVPGLSGQTREVYFIIGQRISDNSIVLNCHLTRDAEGNMERMPNLYRWKIGGKRFGFRFQTEPEAKAFDKELRIAIKEINEGVTEKPPCPLFLESELDDDDEDDEEIFMTLDLPVTGMDSPSASDSSPRDVSQATPQEQAAQMSHFFGAIPETEGSTESAAYDYLEIPIGQKFAHPDKDGTGLVQQDPSGSVMNKGAEASPQNETKSPKKDKKKTGRRRCRYCHEIYLEEDNKRGACEYAPDCVRTTIEEVACIRAARCMTYHCMSDDEGEFVQHPCQCTSGDESSSRWIGLAFLSIFVPCLCLYPPLRTCHWCFLRAGVCGGRHRSAS